MLGSGRPASGFLGYASPCRASPVCYSPHLTCLQLIKPAPDGAFAFTSLSLPPFISGWSCPLRCSCFCCWFPFSISPVLLHKTVSPEPLCSFCRSRLSQRALSSQCVTSCSPLPLCCPLLSDEVSPPLLLPEVPSAPAQVGAAMILLD